MNKALWKHTNLNFGELKENADLIYWIVYLQISMQTFALNISIWCKPQLSFPCNGIVLYRSGMIGMK